VESMTVPELNAYLEALEDIARQNREASRRR
jgi:hypothetical protein